MSELSQVTRARFPAVPGKGTDGDTEPCGPGGAHGFVSCADSEVSIRSGRPGSVPYVDFAASSPERDKQWQPSAPPAARPGFPRAVLQQEEPGLLGEGRSQGSAREDGSLGHPLTRGKSKRGNKNQRASEGGTGAGLEGSPRLQANPEQSAAGATLDYSVTARGKTCPESTRRSVSWRTPEANALSRPTDRRPPPL